MVKNIFSLAASLALILSIGLACNMFKGTPDAESDSGDVNKNQNPQDVADSSDKKVETEATSTKDEKADFDMTAEELDKEFTREGVTDKDLEKYASKIIAVSGRVSTLATEKTGSVQPWVTLFAPGVLHGVSCYFDDDNVDQMKKLTKGKMAKVQGLQSDFIVPKISPRLDNCVVLEEN